MLPEQRSRLVVVLVRARNPSNIGAVARAMHDFGFSDLRIVSDFPVPLAAARATHVDPVPDPVPDTGFSRSPDPASRTLAEKAAVQASSVLAAATEHTTLAAAIADCTLVLGTTAVGSRKLDHPLHTLAEAAPLIHAAPASAAAEPPTTRVAVLFGSEKTGLSNDELSLCHTLLTIPMNAAAGRHLSMNLGQAAAVCLYALSTYMPETSPNLPLDAPHLASKTWDGGSQLATSADLDRLTALLLEVLDLSGYTRRHPANSRPNTLHRLVRRMSNSPSDAAMWHGILRQLLHQLRS